MREFKNSSASDSADTACKVFKSYDIGENELLSEAELAKDYAISKGILMRTSDLSQDTRVPLPFCIIPSKFPKVWFNVVYGLQQHLNVVLFKVSHSREFLKECLASAIQVDEFTANIFKIFETVEQENQENEKLSLGLIRSDYLLDCDSSGNVIGIKQVENNTIASSFGGLSSKMRDLHEFTLGRFGYKSLDSKLPVNRSSEELAKGIFTAWEAYGNASAVILFVVEERTLNICDQRALEFAILEMKSDITILRSSFKELRASADLKGRTLLVNGKEVAVVYYRVGYMPEHYESEDWDVRLLMEKSSAIKCPSAGLHLAGTKRVQLELTAPGVLEKFVDPNIATELRKVFVNQYSLDVGEEGDKAISLGIKNPEKYVLKPEREGGGNNIYDADIRTVLESIKDTDNRKAHILMERIFPPSFLNCIITQDKVPTLQTIICELGIFGVILGSKTCIKLNNCAGHLLRSKGSSCNETGIAAGFGALDSPYLE